MVSVKSWQEAIAKGRRRPALCAHDLFTAEKAAYSAYEERMREMAKAGNGVIAHDGVNNRMILSNAISLLAIGDEDGFRKSVDDFAERAAWDPVHFSALSYGLQAVDGFLKTKERAL
jgi:hypothetical protein